MASLLSPKLDPLALFRLFSKTLDMLYAVGSGTAVNFLVKSYLVPYPNPAALLDLRAPL